MSSTHIHHVQLAMPRGGEEKARQFYTSDPFGNRVELLAAVGTGESLG